MKRVMKITLAVLLIASVMGLGVTGCAKPAPVPAPTPAPALTPTPTPVLTPAPAPTPEVPYYKGKTINLVLAHAAGSATDTFFRPTVTYLTRHIPGNPAIIIRNMPAGGGAVGVNYVYEVAKPDGFTMLGVSGGKLQSQWLDPKGVKYDLAKMPLIFTAVSGAVGHFGKAGIAKEAKDLVTTKEPLKYGGGGSPVTGVYMTFLLAAELLGIPLESTIWGLGAGERALGVVRGMEMNLVTTSLDVDVIFEPLRKAGDITLLMVSNFNPQGEEVRDPLKPEVPTVSEVYQQIYGKPPSGILWESYKFTAMQRYMDKGFFAPPGTPQKVVDILRKAAEQMINDPDVQKDWTKMFSEAEIVIGPEGERQIKEGLEERPEIMAFLKEYFSKEYGVKFE